MSRGKWEAVQGAPETRSLGGAGLHSVLALAAAPGVEVLPAPSGLSALLIWEAGKGHLVDHSTLLVHQSVI